MDNKTFSNETAHSVLTAVFNKLTEKYDDDLTVAIGIEETYLSEFVEMKTLTAEGVVFVTVFYNKRDGELYEAVLRDRELKGNITSDYLSHIYMTGIDTTIDGIADVIGEAVVREMVRLYEKSINTVNAA